MERQEHLIFGFQIMPNSFYWVVLAVLLLSVSGWGSCTYQDNLNPKPTVCGSTCRGNSVNSYNESYPACEQVGKSLIGTTYSSYGVVFYTVTSVRELNGCWNGANAGNICGGCGSILSGYSCGSKCESDSIACVSTGGGWDSQNCQCNTCTCDYLQSQCESINGIFEGNCANADPNGGQCCVGTCYLCNTEAARKQQEMAKRVCCAIPGLVPPKLSDYCFDMPPPR